MRDVATRGIASQTEAEPLLRDLSFLIYIYISPGLSSKAVMIQGQRTSMEAAAAPGVGDVELVCKTLQVEHKLFYFDLKENPRGRYLKISEKTSGSRSTIIVPIAGVVWFVDLFNYYANGDEPELSSKELQLDTKVIFSLSALSIMRLLWKHQGTGLRWLGHMGYLQFSLFNSHEFCTSN